MSELRTELQSAIEREKTAATNISHINVAQAKLRDLTATQLAAKADLDALELDHKAKVTSWAANGAEGNSPKRDETKFSEAKARLEVIETDVADSQLALSTLDGQFQDLATALRAEGDNTNNIIIQIELAEANRLLDRLDAIETERQSLRAQLMGLVMVLGRLTANNPNLNKDLENLRNRLSMLPPDPTDVQCQTARLNWQHFERDLRSDPETPAPTVSGRTAPALLNHSAA
jgi:chromosome segregation ATPase